MKERLETLMADKKGRYIIAGIVIILAVLAFQLMGSKGPEKEEGVDLTLDKESSVPIATVDSALLNKSRLELQEEAVKKENQNNVNTNSAFDFSSWKEQKDNSNIDPSATQVGRSTDLAQTISAPSRNIASDPQYYEHEDFERQKELERIKAEEKRKLLLTLLELKKQSIKEKEKDKKPKDEFVEVEKPGEAETNGVINSITALENSDAGNGFHGLISAEKQKIVNAGFNKEFANIRAVIHSQTTIMNGGRLELRLLEPISIKGKVIAKGTLLYGIANFGTERVRIAVSSMVVDGLIIPIKMAVFDMDGMEGIYVPNVLAVDAMKQAGAQSVQGVNVPTVGIANNIETAVGLSVLNAATQGIKSYASRKILQQKATLKSNYFIYLKNIKQ
jgi:hypothetical protein